MKNILLVFLFVICIPLFPVTNVSIQVIHLPTAFEGLQVAFTGNLNGWSNSSTTATVTNGTLNYTLNNISLTSLTSEWIDMPAGANAGFRFVKSGTWDSLIRAYFQTNDCNFRLALTADADNAIVIDAKNEIMPIVDQAKSVTVNGTLEDATPMNQIDITKFTFPGGKWKALIMSYDDSGYQDRTLVNIFNTYGIVGSFNIISGSLGNADKISSSEVTTLYANGNHEVALHTVSHPYLESLSDNDQYHQIADCQSVVSNLVGYKVTGMAYPFGTYDKRVLATLKNLGIIYSRTTINTFDLAIPNDIPGDLLRWNPTCHDSSADYYGTQLIEMNKEQMALLYIWGHSWEHSSDWSSITAFCQKIGKRNDIWYAKAWDVAHYLMAVANVVKIGESGWYNPSVDTSVWIKTPDGIVELKPEQTYTAVDEIQGNAGIKIYLSRYKEYLCVEVPETARVSIFNMKGQLMARQQIKNPESRISIQGIPTGNYVVQVNVLKKIVSTKIIL